MSDEFSSNFPYEKRAFISKLNPETPPFLPSSYYQHIQQPTFSSDDHQNHLHIQPIVNGHHDNHEYNSTAIYSIEPSEHRSSQAHYIQETGPDNQHPTTSSHIEPLTQTKQEEEEDEDIKEEKINQISFQHSTFFNNEEASNHLGDENQPNLSLVDDDTSNVKLSLDEQSNLDEKPAELKAQRELDEDEIPPFDQPLTHIETNVIDNSPLTELESPYEQHQANESSSLPDVVAQTLEQNQDDITLQSELDDILGNKSLLKQTITPGKSDTRPTRNTMATVSYKLFLIDDSTSNSRLIETISHESFFVGEYDILPAIDISIQLMNRGEHALIDSDVRHCYGQIGCEEKQIPPVSSTDPYRMKIDLEFHDWKPSPDIQTLSIDDRLFWGDKKRQLGNNSYRRKEYSTALQCYLNALKFLDTDENPILNEDKQESILIDRYIQVQNNLAQVYLLTNQYDQCLDAVNKVFRYEPKNIKALFRHGKALFELGNYDQVVQPFKLLLQIQNADVDKEKVIEILNICEAKLAKYQKNEKEIYRRMFKPTTAPTINEKPKIEIAKKADTKNNTWWTYLAMGSAVLAAVGLAAVIKYR